MEEGSRNSRYQARMKKAALCVESLELGAVREKYDPGNIEMRIQSWQQV